MLYEVITDNLDRVHEVAVRGAKTLGAKLETHRDAAMLARRLTGIACDAPIEDPETKLRRSMPDLGAIVITSYSIHYTKLYETARSPACRCSNAGRARSRSC